MRRKMELYKRRDQMANGIPTEVTVWHEPATGSTLWQASREGGVFASWGEDPKGAAEPRCSPEQLLSEIVDKISADSFEKHERFQ